MVKHQQNFLYSLSNGLFTFHSNYTSSSQGHCSPHRSFRWKNKASFSVPYPSPTTVAANWALFFIAPWRLLFLSVFSNKPKPSISCHQSTRPTTPPCGHHLSHSLSLPEELASGSQAHHHSNSNTTAIILTDFNIQLSMSIQHPMSLSVPGLPLLQWFVLHSTSEITVIS